MLPASSTDLLGSEVWLSRIIFVVPIFDYKQVSRADGLSGVLAHGCSLTPCHTVSLLYYMINLLQILICYIDPADSWICQSRGMTGVECPGAFHNIAWPEVSTLLILDVKQALN